MTTDSRQTLRFAPSAGPSSFDPHQRLIELAPDASPYQLAHERAHATQQEHATLAWRFHQALPSWLPYLPRLTQLWVEWQARNLALGALASCGRLNRAAKAEASRCLATYFLALLWIPTPTEVATAEVTSAETARRIMDRDRRNARAPQPTALPELIAKAAETPRFSGSSNPPENPRGNIAGVSRNRPPRAS